MKKLLLVSLCFLMLSITQVFAQNRTVTGTVTSKDDGTPIPGVSVTIKGTSNGVATNSAGKYSLSVPPGAVLVFKAIGFTPVETSPKSGNLNVSLTTASTQIGEVVVTSALGQKVQARSLGYATAQIDSKQLNQAAVTDISTGLQGKVSGLQVNLTDNGIDPTTRIVLQGNRSITGNNEALLVVDGVPIDDVNYITTINPEDVASVNVLKGGLAAAVYGSKAANGVLIITTKKGSKGKPSITVSNTTEIQSVSYIPDLQTKFGGYGGEGGSYVNADGTVNPVPYENESYGPAFDGRKLLMALSPIYSSTGAVTGYDSLYTNYSNIPNNRRDFFLNGITNQFNVSYDIGSETSSLHVGFQDVDQGGVIPDDHDRRDNIRIGGTENYGKFSVEYNAAYSQNNVSTYGPSYNQTGGGFTGDPFYFELLNTPADIPLTKMTLQSTTGPVVYDPSNLNGQYSNVNSYYNAYSTNPYWTLQNSRELRDTYTFQGNINLAWKATPWLTFSDRLGITSLTEQYNYSKAGVTFEPWAVADPEKAGNVPSSLKSTFGATFNQTFQEQLLNNDFIASFDKKINSDFKISGLVGGNMQQSYQTDIYLQGNELQFPGDYNITSTLGIPLYNQYSFKERDDAIYEEATIGFKNYLFLHGTNRDEWNSVLNPAHDHYEYPSVDASFVFTDAIGALKDNSILSYGKLTAGIAEVANINLGNGTNAYGAYSLVNPFNVAGGFPFGSIGGYGLASLSLNPNIQPEKTTDKEIGLDLGFLKDNRIHLTANYAHSDSRNQSLTATVSTATGFNSELTNAGLVTNDVIELDLNTIVVKTRNFQWNLGINYTHFANKVVELAPGQNQLNISNGGAIYAVKGQPYPIIETEDFVRAPNGKVIVDPTTGQPSVSSNLTTYGTTNPTKIVGINSTLSYKGFSLSFVLDYRGGDEILNSTEATEAFTGISAQSAENGRQRFIFPNSVVLQNGQYVNNTSVAVDNGNGGQGGSFWAGIYGSSIGSIYVDNAEFLKLREANLTYQIPTSVLASALPFVKRASIAIIGRNLLMFRPKSNNSIDPEFSDAGSGNAIGTTSVSETPPTRFYGATLSVSF